MPQGISQTTGAPNWQGRSHTLEAKKRISDARALRKERDGFLNSEQARKKMSESAKRRSEIARSSRPLVPEKPPKTLTYGGWQAWAKRALGNIRHCGKCESTAAKRFCWVCITEEPSKDKSSWIRLCYSCFNKRNSGVVWNKGVKTGIVPRSAIKKGQTLSPSTAFKPGVAPVNKGKKMPAISGPKHHNWKGGTTDENHKLRDSVEYKEWRRSVFSRDRFSCVMCGYRSRVKKPCDIRADHIQPFCLFPELRFDIKNGRTLCIPCDKKHGWRPGRPVCEPTGDCQFHSGHVKET